MSTIITAEGIADRAQRAAVDRAQRRLNSARAHRDAFTWSLPRDIAAVKTAERQLNDAHYPATRDTMTLIVDETPITFTLDYLAATAEYLVQTLQPTERLARSARIALQFSGADHACDGYDEESDQFFAIGSYPIDQLPA